MELICHFDRRKSFYGKARVTIENGVAKLVSYSTLVSTAIFKDNKWEVTHLGRWSMTTSRHQREFERQLTECGRLL